MRRHIVAAFGAVCEVISIFWNEAVEECFQVAARRRIGILHDDNAATSVLGEGRHRPIAHAALINLRLDFIGDFVKPLTVGANFELFVMNAHCDAY